MKKIIALCSVTLIVTGLWIYHKTKTPMLYGEFTGAPKANVIDLIREPKKHAGKTWAIDGIITDQCTTMGCFFYLKADGKALRVDLEEIAMWAPKGRNGKPVRAEGQMVPRGDGYQFWASAVEFKQ